MAEVKPSLLANTVMAKLFDVLTNGDDTVPASQDNFFSWCTPGIPVDPSDFEFLEQGLTGVIKTRNIEALPPEGVPSDSDAGQPTGISAEALEQLRAQDANRMYMQAEGLARLVDFIPDAAKAHNEQFTRLSVMNNEGTLSDVYSSALRMSQVMHTELPAETKAKIERFRGLLSVTRTKKNLIDDSETQVQEPSPLVVAYHEKMEKYINAALEYNNRRIDALVASNQRAVHDFAVNATLYREKVKAAMRDWQTTGYKSDYESIAAFIDQVQARDMALLKEEYKDSLERSRLTGIASGGDFYFTSLVPGSFARSAGWSRFTFDSGDHKSRSSSSNQYTRWGASGGGGFLGVFGGRAKHSNSQNRTEFNGTFSSERFGLSFEICQIPIVRPWFKSAFLTSKTWRFDPAVPDTRGRALCDGGNPPAGMLPAYPTTIVLIRKLRLTLGKSEGFSSFVQQQRTTSTSGGSAFSFGPIFLGGSANRLSSGGSSERDWGFKYENESVQVDGMQIVGFKCHILPKCPDPDSAITTWI